jgi:protein-L-isoaspartate(D-aspartate) O-methyltransferase
MFSRRSQASDQGRETPGAAPYTADLEEMIEHQLRRRGVVMHSVLEAMRAVPRHLFVGHEHSAKAYADEALPSQEGQTISQPYMVGIMTQELRIKPGQRVLELGTGTGYQTAVLAHLVGGEGRVYTIERVQALSEFARRRLGAMEVRNVRYLVGDGSEGWPRKDEHWDGERSASGEPLFDRILVTAGAPDVPQPLVAQLAEGGILVVPVGNGESQTLMRVERKGPGAHDVELTRLLDCRFVPLVGAHAWKEGQITREGRHG